jgi:EAL domain-containing protein (putative c-di-GMP-specific phosphodiesterase class I)
VSSEPQRVSAALTSDVNPGGIGAHGHSAGWLELWYQPKIGSQALDLRGAEALIRMRHPRLGVIQPAHFIPHMGDRLLPALSQFVVTQALADWRYFLAEQRPLDLSINLPISFLEDPKSFDYLCRQLPDDPAFAGLILEVDGSDITRDLAAARDFAKQARLRKLAISVDRLGSEWTTLLRLRDFPFVEIKVEPELVAGCAYDREADAVPAYCQCGQSIRRPHGRCRDRELRRFLYGARTGLRPGSGLPVWKAHGCPDLYARDRARSDKRGVIARSRVAEKSLLARGPRRWVCGGPLNPIDRGAPRPDGRLRGKPLYCRYGNNIAPG